MKKLCLLLLILIVLICGIASCNKQSTEPTKSTNMITNGDFSNGLNHWGLYYMNGAKATITIEDGFLKVNIDSIGTDGYGAPDIQVSQGGLDLIKDRDYQLTFDAWADADRLLDTSIWENGHDVDGDGFAWSTHGYDVHNITTTRITITYTFNMALTNHDAGLVFLCGDYTIDLYIDNVSFKEL